MSWGAPRSGRWRWWRATRRWCSGRGPSRTGPVGSWTTTVADVVEEWHDGQRRGRPRLDRLGPTRRGDRERRRHPGRSRRRRCRRRRRLPAGSPGWVCTSCGPAPRVMPLAAVPQPRTSRVPSDAGRRGGPADRHRHRAGRPRSSRSLRHGAGTCVGPGHGPGHSGDVHLGDPDRQRHLGVGVVVQIGDRPHRVEGHPHVGTGQRRKRHRTRSGSPPARTLSASGGRATVRL